MSRSRRGATDLSGILLVDKPQGMTSHDVVGVVRRATGERRVGHAGTLDPMATGLLVVLVGPMTRLERFVSAAYKTYEATIAFGTATDTEDAEGEVTATAPVPEALFDESEARALLAGFLGPRMQAPPAYSAIKVGGQTAHRVARAGGELALERRAIDVQAAELLGTDATASQWQVRFTVSKGTYIRSLARDIGLAAGTVAHLAALRRTESGGLRVAGSATLDQIRAAGEQGCVRELFTDPLAALALPVIDVTDEAAEAVRVGKPLETASAEQGAGEGSLSAVAHAGHLLGVYRRESDRLRPEVVLARPA